MSNSSGRALSTFPLHYAVQRKLAAIGFTTIDDFYNVSPEELANEANMTPVQALEVLSTLFEDVQASVRTPAVPKARSALDLIQEERTQGKVVTFSESLDDHLGGGVPLGKITEICGCPGIGKTQMCLQLAVDVHIPECLGGLNGEALYIDTENCFVVERLIDIANATLEHCKFIGQQEGKNLDILKDFSLEKVLSGMYCYRCGDHTELMAILHTLPKFLKEHEKVKVVIIDSITSPFRHVVDDFIMRTRVIAFVAQKLQQLACQHQIAIVLTNQMTTKIMPGGESSHLIPALGETWAHVSTIRLVLFWEKKERRYLFYKLPNKKESTCSFQITRGGIRDVTRKSLSEETSDTSELQATGAQKDVTQTLPSTSSQLATQTESHSCPPGKRLRVT